jgi:uncharacterized protein with PQ loop repeat
VERAEAAIEPHVDRVVVLIGVLYPFAMAPQLYNVWALHRTAGLSGVTYCIGLAMALAWTVYGLVHREKAIWMLNTIWVGVHSAMIAGLLR